MKKKYVFVNIKRPIYGTYVGVREKYIWEAKRKNALLHITIPQGTCIISPDEYLMGATRIEKVFKIPDKPMILYCKELTVNQPIQDISPNRNVLERLREEAIEKGWYRPNGRNN